LGSALIVNNAVIPLELAHLPYRKGTYEDYVGRRALVRFGRKKWQKNVTDVVDRLRAALQPDEVVLGGGNTKKLKESPPGCRMGRNADAFPGGFRLWSEVFDLQTSSVATTTIGGQKKPVAS
jgi:polyphosphate glucokinase